MTPAPGRQEAPSVLHLVVTIAVAMAVVYGGLGVLVPGFFQTQSSTACIALPPPSSSTTTAAPGWHHLNAPEWELDGKPVLFFYTATWAPYGAASSWIVWKAMTEFGTVRGAQFDSYSSSSDVYSSTPEVRLANVNLSNSPIAFEVSGYPSTSDCVQAAYVSTYGDEIPFVAIGGQYILVGALASPGVFQNFSGTGDAAVASALANETGPQWTASESAVWWVVATLAKECGQPVAELASTYHWSSDTVVSVTADYGQL